ncbi:MAG: segregation/condensation protein A [Nanoarchaeota archaeon]|nr:segregation/condensation protein A [Nanoarchaeota archaeon]
MDQHQIFDMLFNKDEITWKGMIYDLVRCEQMDPWDINITILAKRFVQEVKKFKDTDLRISGKIILAAAILLKMKSTKLMEDDITGLDTLIASFQQTEDEIFEELLDYENPDGGVQMNQQPNIHPRTPQPRKRKVSVFDLVEALEKALEVSARRKPVSAEAPKMLIPEKGRDIELVMKDVYNQVVKFFRQASNKMKTLTFTNLLPSEDKIDVIYTFIPLLHLDNQRKIDLMQKESFGAIEIKLLDKKAALAA